MTDQDFSADDAASDGSGAPVDPNEITDSDDAGELDLAAIEADFDDVQAALTRLADGTYWTDEVTGDLIPAEVLAASPLARRS